jgi:probable D-alanyl-D-alanine dipeptidase
MLRYLLPTLFLCVVTASAQRFDSLMRANGMVDIQQVDPDIRVELKYATKDNFIGANMYGQLRRAYLHPNLAKALARAQQALTKERPGYRFLIYDAARPQSVQRRMYQAVAGTPKKIYVAAPERGGRHNYGVAVDLTIVDASGKPLDMGSPFDHFGEEAHLGNEEARMRAGIFNKEVPANRSLMRRLLGAEGLRPYDKEWWHYQEQMSMSEVRKRYQLLSF